MNKLSNPLLIAALALSVTAFAKPSIYDEEGGALESTNNSYNTFTTPLQPKKGKKSFKGGVHKTKKRKSYPVPGPKNSLETI